MGELRRITIDLDDAATALLDRLVATDRFSDGPEVVRYALAMLADRERQDDEDWQTTLRLNGIERLRALIDEGLASGEPVEATADLFEDVKRRGRERLARMRAAE